VASNKITAVSIAGKTGSLADAYLNSPLSGIAPWILMSVLSTPGRFEEAVCFALGLSLLTTFLGWRRGQSIHALEVFGVVVFAVLAVVALVVSPGAIRFLELWAGELVNGLLALFVVATIVVRRPFTLPYAKETAPQEYWNTAVFMRINYGISWVWAGAFAFSAVVGFYGDAVLRDSNNFWTGWVLQLAAIFFAITFTEFYPDYLGAKDAAARGESEEAPSPIKLVEWVPTFVLIGGIFGWVTDAIPDAVGTGMLAVGIVGNIVVGKIAPAKSATT
jgi:hypothetical protein